MILLYTPEYFVVSRVNTKYEVLDTSAKYNNSSTWYVCAEQAHVNDHQSLGMGQTACILASASEVRHMDGQITFTPRQPPTAAVGLLGVPPPSA